ncbi:unnamed protein product [Arctogadus glacialis]
MCALLFHTRRCGDLPLGAGGREGVVSWGLGPDRSLPRKSTGTVMGTSTGWVSCLQAAGGSDTQSMIQTRPSSVVEV